MPLQRELKTNIVRVLSAITTSYSCLHEARGLISDPNLIRHISESIEKMHVALPALQSISEHVRGCENGDSQ